MPRLLLLLLFITLLLFHLAPLQGQMQQHPIAYNTKADIAFIKKTLPTNAFLAQSYNAVKAEVDESVGKDVDVPFPKDPAGGYTHERHKANYLLMFNSSLLYQITGEVKYAALVKAMFLKYAAINPTLKNHPEAKSNSPGRLFHQALNDANWLVYTGLAFDGIHDYLTPAERKQIADGAFKPEVDFFTGELNSWFNLIHNHAVWACAGVGIVGIATDNDAYTQMALKGSKLDGKTGFLANIDGLFSPEGYYTEGPYYTRYAILPFYLFANALNNAQLSLKIFNQKNNVLQKALTNALQQTNINGNFYSYNDALKDKTFTSNELIEAIDIAWNVFGADETYLPVVKQQDKVTLSAGGVKTAIALVNKKKQDKYYAYKPIEFTDGAKGDEGGVSIMRLGKGDSLTSLIYKYTSHGLSHGHYDKLNINLYDAGNEVLQDYGAVRFIGIEQKYGGRYLPETKSYAAQTIAHNTVVVDETSHFNGKEEESQQYHPTKLFSNVTNGKVQVVSVEDNKAYKDVVMQRTVFLLQLPDRPKPLLVDLFKLQSNNQHQYDLPFQYNGTFIKSSFKYKSLTNSQSTLGAKNGYQHIWKEAEAKADKPLSQFTFLNDKTFYSISTLTDDSTNLYFTRIGANDPNFNLRREPAFIIRKKGSSQFFFNVVEIHGNFNPNVEIATGAYSAVSKMELLQNDSFFTVAEVSIGGKPLFVIQCNNNFNKLEKHTVTIHDKTYDFTGPYSVIYNYKNL